MEYNVINIRNLYRLTDEKKVIELFGNFQCPLNTDIENFLKNKAIEFSKKSIAETFIVTTNHNNKEIIVGYFSLAMKVVKMRKDVFKGKTKNRIERFTQLTEDKKNFELSLPLIGQLSKNYYSNCNNFISGNDLLKLACQKIIEAQNIVGGRFAFIECADTPKLVSFYENNGFRTFGKRKLDADEKKHSSGEYLLRMICDLSNID